jgi:hypothetical protein
MAGGGSCSFAARPLSLFGQRGGRRRASIDDPFAGNLRSEFETSAMRDYLRGVGKICAHLVPNLLSQLPGLSLCVRKDRM